MLLVNGEVQRNVTVPPSGGTICNCVAELEGAPIDDPPAAPLLQVPEEKVIAPPEPR